MGFERFSSWREGARPDSEGSTTMRPRSEKTFQAKQKPRIAGLCFIRPWWAHQGSNLGPAD